MTSMTASSDSNISLVMLVRYWYDFQNSEYDQEIPQSKNRRQPRGTVRKSRSTITRHQEDKLSKATSSLFPIKMIAILEWT